MINAKIAEAEALLEKVTDSSIRQNAMETLTGLKSSLLLGTKDNNTISAEVDSLLALLKKVNRLRYSSKMNGAYFMEK
ncbi:histidine triad protein D [Streptococcus pneumoniae]|nr:histidine triad protein D [Streptococcus pneumoniae]